MDVSEVIQSRSPELEPTSSVEHAGNWAVKRYYGLRLRWSISQQPKASKMDRWAELWRAACAGCSVQRLFFELDSPMQLHAMHDPCRRIAEMRVERQSEAIV